MSARREVEPRPTVLLQISTCEARCEHGTGSAARQQSLSAVILIQANNRQKMSPAHQAAAEQSEMLVGQRLTRANRGWACAVSRESEEARVDSPPVPARRGQEDDV